ncbi:hypothetical protein LCGC14_0923720 [marine sediment metagenome]|uniref:Uncharacterized protein n=1 Tax=marine sediment metagenome TaxID=412755 RepID=A0A0F9PAP6_9ZZZZ
MGLDMYLNKRTYVQRWEHQEKNFEITALFGGEQSHIDSERVSYVEEQIGYWRKANAIHAWFVEHVQNGVDDCGKYDVSKENLQELLDAVNEVLAKVKLEKGIIQSGSTLKAGETEFKPNFEAGETIVDTSKAEELLPTQAGFFFGSQDYDEYYHADLVETKEICAVALKEIEHASISYRSSW